MWGTENPLVAIARAHGDALASLGAAAGQHSRSALGFHPATESVHLRTAPPVRLESTLRHETSNSSEENYLPKANCKYISRWALVASQASGEEAKQRANHHHRGHRDTQKNDGKMPSRPPAGSQRYRLEGVNVTQNCASRRYTLRKNPKEHGAAKKNFWNARRMVGNGNVVEVRQFVEQNFSARVSQKNFCTSCAALMELLLDECARLRQIADSSEKSGVRTACERQWKTC
jgi:hypothetical protein